MPTLNKRTRTPRRTRKTRRGPHRRRKGSARPMRSLRQSYRGTPNQYRFVRETLPLTINIGAAGNGVTILPSSAGEAKMSVLQFPFFNMNQLTRFTAEFNPLFVNYKVDKIETVLIPQWQQSVNVINSATSAATCSDLVVTRVSTKYLNNGFTIAGSAMDQRMHLAQIQMKTRSLYGSRKWLRCNTVKPGVKELIYSGDPPVQTGEKQTKSCPWLSINTANQQEFLMNDVIFFDRVDGAHIDAAPLYSYRMYHRVYFRVSQVG